MTHEESVSQKPWYKNPWLLFLLAFPFASIIMGGITLYLAISRPISIVEDNYYKQGLAINQEMAAIENARKLNLKLQLSFATGLVNIKSNQALANTTQQLQLYFSHNLNGKLDKSVIANRIDAFTFSTTMSELPKGLWYISVNPAENEKLWRIKGKINNHEQQTFSLTSKMR